MDLFAFHLNQNYFSLTIFSNNKNTQTSFLMNLAPKSLWQKKNYFSVNVTWSLDCFLYSHKWQKALSKGSLNILLKHKKGGSLVDDIFSKLLCYAYLRVASEPWMKANSSIYWSQCVFLPTLQSCTAFILIILLFVVWFICWIYLK